MEEPYHSHLVELTLTREGYLQLPGGERYRIMLMSENQKVCASVLEVEAQCEIFTLICDYFTDTSFEFLNLDHATLTETDLIIPHEGVVVKFHSNRGFTSRTKAVFNKALALHTESTLVRYFTFESIK